MKSMLKQGKQRALEGRPRSIHFVEKHNSRSHSMPVDASYSVICRVSYLFYSPVELSPYAACLCLHAFHRINKNNSTVHDSARAFDLHSKIRMPWSVNEVESPIFPLHRNACRLDGNAPFAFNRKVVRNCATSVDGPRSGNIRGFEKDGFSECSFARV